MFYLTQRNYARKIKFKSFLIYVCYLNSKLNQIAKFWERKEEKEFHKQHNLRTKFLCDEFQTAF